MRFLIVLIGIVGVVAILVGIALLASSNFPLALIFAGAVAYRFSCNALASSDRIN